jgi:hypothetical protein
MQSNMIIFHHKFTFISFRQIFTKLKKTFVANLVDVGKFRGYPRKLYSSSFVLCLLLMLAPPRGFLQR